MGAQGSPGAQGPAGAVGPAGPPGPKSATIAEYEFDENTGATSFTDTSGLANTLTSNLGGVGAGSVLAHSGKAVVFSAIEGMVAATGNQIPDSAQIWTELWLRTGDPTQTATLFEKVGGYKLRLIGGIPEFTVTTAGGPCAVAYSAALTANTWTQVAGWYDGLTVVVAVNGVAQSKSCSSGRIALTLGSAMTVGGKLTGASWSDVLSGNVDELRIRAVAPFRSASGSGGNVPVWRWTTFHTHHPNYGWWWNNEQGMQTLGIRPSDWTDGNATVDQISANKDWLRSVLSRRGTGGKNAAVIQDNFIYYSSTDGPVTIAMFRIKNTTSQPLTWSPQFAVTYYQSWGERASVALNGANQWTSSGDCNSWACQQTVSLSIPPNRTSSVLFAALGGNPSNYRPNVLVINNDSAELPPGLSYVDDFDTMTGDWSQ